MSQVVNYSFMDKKELKKLNYPETDKVYNAIKIMNPISEEYPDMRTTSRQTSSHSGLQSGTA